MPTKPWTKTRVQALRALVELDASPAEIASALGRSETSVVAKLAHMKHGDRMRAAVLAATSGPAPRKNDDAKHLALIAAANVGCGFPAFDLPATYRRAA